MRSVNKVILVGHLGADPEVKHLDKGSIVSRLRLATNRSYKDKDGNFKDETDWHSIVFWNQLAESTEKYLHKGSLVYVEGRLRTRSWQDKEGATKYATEVVGDTYIALDKKSDSPDREVSTAPAANVTDDQPADDLPF
jgi:single-strand DNA-binding protein